MRAFRSLPFVALLVVGCRIFDSGGPQYVADGTVVLVDNLAAAGWPSDAIRIDSVATGLEEPLTVLMNYGAGCREHHVALLVERTFRESQPPVLRARLAHNAHGEMCKALAYRTIKFDLSVVREHFRAAYGSGAGAFALDVTGAPRVTHAFR
jgi:hypothetical protein